MNSFRCYFPGIFLILLGITVVAVPEILVALIAATIMLSGIWSLYLGHLIRKSETTFEIFGKQSTDRAFDGWHFVKDPVLRWRHRR
jgi:hypothetical protein